ncbi:MAG: DUF4041 domain-containing protein [Bacteroidetes bacterium]|jgi:hypothetical protein|nr:DUF4041 domain-containing protein [Bacteroidota bacterium]
MDNTLFGIIFALSLAFIGVLVWALKANSKNKYYEKKYSKIIDVDSAVEVSTKERDAIDNDIANLRGSYSEKRKIFDRLVREAAIYNEEIELAELGFYKPHYDFDTSEKFKEEIERVKSKQKEYISDKTAIYGTTEFVVEGSEAKGRAMTNRAIRLTARAFNKECDVAIATVKWNNIVRMEERVKKAFDAINKLNASSMVVISSDYLKLKIKELRLTHEYREKKQQEKEEQAEIRRHMREESKLEQETERAIKEEDKFQKLLDKAKSEAAKAAGAQLEKLQQKIAQLDVELAEAQTKSERAKSMAQQTKSGHVYVISNEGSFGDEVCKIGMTRRLEPLDRVKELGDASVPFLFDVHAMIYSDDAPSLENALHKKFDWERLNLVNSRKEFFRVSLDEIAKEVKSISPDAEFVETAEARQFRESLAIRAQREQQKSQNDVRNELPDAI